MSKTVLITGASRGIGAATARLFAQKGYAVAVHYNKSRKQAETLVGELPGAKLYRADVSKREGVFAMVGDILRDFGHIDVLVCCAGVARQELFDTMSETSWREILGTDLDGTAFCCQAVLPDMLRRKSGKIITVSSMWGQVGASCEVAYSVAKAGVIGLTKALSKEVAPSGITVNCVAPGVIETDMMVGFSGEDKAALIEETPLGRLGTPKDVAEAIWFLASLGGDFFTGQVLAPNGGFVI